MALHEREAREDQRLIRGGVRQGHEAYDRARGDARAIETREGGSQSEEGSAEESHYQDSSNRDAAHGEEIRADEAEDQVEVLVANLQESEDLRKDEEIRRVEGRQKIDGSSRTQTSSDGQQYKYECNISYSAEGDAVFGCGHAYCCMVCAFAIPKAEGKYFAPCSVCRSEGPFRRLRFS